MVQCDKYTHFKYTLCEVSALIVTFFGHRDTSEAIAQSLEHTLTQLIADHPSIHFYLGNQGNFDALVYRTLAKLSCTHPRIRIRVVLAYMPTLRDFENMNTIFPDGLEKVPPKYAIYKRNEWMLHKADLVITHVISPAGGAARFKEKAEKMGKPVINITK